jgi:hypothetical protein
MRTRTIDLFLLVILVFDGSEEERCGIWENEPSQFEILVSCKKHGVEHGLVEQEVSHPFGDDDVELLHGEFGFFEFSLDKGDF